MDPRRGLGDVDSLVQSDRWAEEVRAVELVQEAKQS